MNFTNLDLPAFLALLKVRPENFMRTQEVPPGPVVMGVKPAMTFRELGNGAPIRVEALDVAQAGVDSAVYGYVAYPWTGPAVSSACRWWLPPVRDRSHPGHRLSYG
jgi:hypothetical protein